MANSTDPTVTVELSTGPCYIQNPITGADTRPLLSYASHNRLVSIELQLQFHFNTPEIEYQEIAGIMFEPDTGWSPAWVRTRLLSPVLSISCLVTWSPRGEEFRHGQGWVGEGDSLTYVRMFSSSLSIAIKQVTYVRIAEGGNSDFMQGAFQMELWLNIEHRIQ